MKKKSLDKILIPFTFLIWGFIIWKVITYSDNPIQGTIEKDNNLFVDSTIDSDTIFIYANYRNPFEHAFSLNSPIKNEEIKPVSKPNISFPEVSYVGTVINNKDKRTRALISLSGKNLVITENEEISGIRIIYIYKDSISVLFQNQRKTITKKNT